MAKNKAPPPVDPGMLSPEKLLHVYENVLARNNAYELSAKATKGKEERSLRWLAHFLMTRALFGPKVAVRVSKFLDKTLGGVPLADDNKDAQLKLDFSGPHLLGERVEFVGRAITAVATLLGISPEELMRQNQEQFGDHLQ